MRIAVFSDTHGNSIALDAVLADIEEAGGVDAYWFLGDAAMIGFDPAGAVERLMALPNLTAVHGNGDSRLAADPASNRQISERHIASTTPEDAALWRSVLLDSEWARDRLKAAGRYEWIAHLPLEQRAILPDGTQVLLVHAAPGTDSGPGIRPEHSDDDIRAAVTTARAGLVLAGHTHRFIDRTVDSVRVVNPGSVSNPPPGEPGTWWMLIEASATGYSMVRRQVAWDIGTMLRQLRASDHPDPSHLLAFWTDTSLHGLP